MIYDEAVRESAQVRVDLALSVVSDEGIEATGEVGDGDPFLGDDGRVAERRPDEIIVSTHPATSSGWLRRDLVERIENASGLPVEHVMVDLAQRGAAVHGHAGGGQQDLQRRRADRRAGCQERPGGPARVHRRGPPDSDGSGPTTAEARARLATDARPPPPRGAVHLGDDRRPRPIHGHHERPGAVHRRRHRDLDAARTSAPGGCGRT